MSNEELIDLFRKVERADYPVCCKCPITNACDDADDRCLFGSVADALEAAEKRIAGLEAEVERLKVSNEELREKQTYIDHWEDKWMTSAKDVPTMAYNHGFFDGEQACNRGAKMYNPCIDCQEFDCYGCEYNKGEWE